MTDTIFLDPYVSVYNENVCEPDRSRLNDTFNNSLRYAVQLKKIQEITLDNLQSKNIAFSTLADSDWNFVMASVVGAARLNITGLDYLEAGILGNMPTYGTAIYPGKLILTTSKNTSLTLVGEADGTVVQLFAAVLVEDGTKDIAMSTPFVYQFTDWHPSSLTVPGEDFPVAGTTIFTQPDITATGPVAGTLTLHLKKAGKYLVTLNLGQSHNAAYDALYYFNLNYGGTGTLAANLEIFKTPMSDVDFPGVRNSWTDSFVVHVTSAPQTVTILPGFNHTGTLAGSLAQHTAQGAVIVQQLS